MNADENLHQQKIRDAGEQAGRVLGEFISIAEDFSKRFEREFSAKGNSCQRKTCLLYTSPSPRDLSTSRMPSSA